MTQELKLEVIKASHTLGVGGAGEGGKVVHRGEGSRAGVDATLLSGTLRYINLAEVGVGLVGLRGPIECKCATHDCTPRALNTLAPGGHISARGNRLSTPRSQLDPRLVQGPAVAATIAATIHAEIIWHAITPPDGLALKGVEQASEARGTNSGRNDIGTESKATCCPVISLPIDS